MSRAYKVQVSESISRHVKVGDGVQSKLEILDILGQDAMREILRQELIGIGFEECEDDVARTDEDGVETRINLKTRAVDISSRVDEEIKVDVDVEIWGEDDNANIEAHNRRRVLDGMEKKADAAEAKLREGVTKKLEAKLGDIRRELDQVVNRVTSSALKQKAASMGEIREISENQETGELVIRIKV